MNCPDCQRDLRGDGSCCDYCGWAMVGGGDDPRLPSNRTASEIRQEISSRGFICRVRPTQRPGGVDRDVERAAEALINICDGIVTMDSDQRRACKQAMITSLASLRA